MRVKIALIFLLTLFLTIPAHRAQAFPDTSVKNKVNFTSDVIYQIITDRFVNGDTNNEKLLAPNAVDINCKNLRSYCGGDWSGITQKINSGYFTDLGITALWISVPVKNITAVLTYIDSKTMLPYDSTSYHGYWPLDMKQPNKVFGTMVEFQALINAAHAKNLKVVIDFVPNHTSPADPLIPAFGQNGELDDNGVLVPNGTYTTDLNNPDKLFHHNCYFDVADNNKYKCGTDFSTLENGIYRNLFDLADLNQNNAFVDKYLRDAIALWIATGIDGIRVDAVKHMPLGWQKSWVQSIHSNASGPVFTFGEWFLSPGEVDARNHYFANTSGMSLLDFRFAQTTRQVFRSADPGDPGDPPRLSMIDLDKMIADTAAAYNQVNDMVTFIDNHDMSRFTLPQSKARQTEQALVFTLASRGVPAIYYGTEQFEPGMGLYTTDVQPGRSDPYNRGMMQFNNIVTPAQQIIKTLAQLRKSNPALAFGSSQQRWLNDDVYIFERSFNANTVLVAINKGKSPATITGLLTKLPGPGKPCDPKSSKAAYSNLLDMPDPANPEGALYGGHLLLVGCYVNTGNEKTSGNAVVPFDLGAGEMGVWAIADTEDSSVVLTPELGHVGPMNSVAGDIVTLSGRHFGSVKGTVSFGAVAVGGNNITLWEDTLIQVKIPGVATVAPGKYDIKVNRNNVASNAYKNFEVLTAPQVTVRFVVNGVDTVFGEDAYLIGNVYELGNNLGVWEVSKAVGPMFNQIEYNCPPMQMVCTWYYDVNVPAGAALDFKLIKKNYPGNYYRWESGSNHSASAPASGVKTITVNFNGSWDPPISPVQ
ncbi:MAG: alpha-amylase family glycosyl hydrolase [Betaproteobacteria bacterium]